MEGEFGFEVGDEKFTLHAGDSLFAPRIIPHVWAYWHIHHLLKKQISCFRLMAWRW